MDIATLGVAVRTQEVDRANQSLDKFSGSAKKAETAARGMGSGATDAARKTVAANDNAIKSTKRLGGAFDAVKRQAIAFGAAIAVALGGRAILNAADQYTEFTNALRVAGVAGNEMATVQDRLFKAANRNGVEIGALSKLYSRASIAATELGASQAELLQFVDGVTAALRLQGGSAASSSGALMQLSQSLSSGIVRAEEFNSILEGAFPIAQAAARGIDGMEGSVAKLRTAIINGEITSREFFEGLLKGFTATEAQAAGMSLTVGQAMTVLGNSFMRLIGSIDATFGVSGALAAGIAAFGRGLDAVARGVGTIAGYLDTIAVAAGTAGTALAFYFGPAIFAAIVTNFGVMATAGVAAFNAITAAMARNPLGALAVGITIAITALYHFRDNVEQAIGVDVIGIVGGAVDKIINSFRAAFEDVKFIWSHLPDMIGALVIGAANATIAHVEGMLNRAAALLNDFVSRVNSIMPKDLQMGTVDPVSIGRVDNPYADRLAGELEAHNARIQEIMDSSPLGALGSMFETTTPEVEDFSGAIQAANDNLDELSGGAGGGVGGAAGAARDALGEVATAAKDAGQAALDFSKDLTKSFVNDVRSGLEQGKGLWRSFADAAINAMNRIGDKLIDLGIDMMFSGLTGGMTAGGTGAASAGGGLFGMIGKLFGFRDGGHPGGMVRGPGTSTSDSILTMLSNGPARVSDTEYIVNARSTRKFLPLLEAVNDNDASRIIDNIPGFFAGGHPGMAGNGPGSGIAGSATGQGPGPGSGGTSAGATGVGGSASGLGGHPGMAGGGAGQHGGIGSGIGGRGGMGGGFGGSGGHPGISGNAAGDHGGGMGVNGAMGGFGGSQGHPGMVGNAAGDHGFAARGSASQSNKGDFGGPTSVAPGFFGALADAVQGFPAGVVAAMTARQNKMQDRLVSSVNKMQDRIAPTRPNVAMKAIQDRVGFETGIPGPKSDLSAIFGDIGQTSDLGFPATATGKTDPANSDLAAAIAAMSGNPVPGNPLGGFPSVAASPPPGLPATPAARDVGIAPSPFAGYESTIDDIFGRLGEASDLMAGANNTLGFHASRVGAAGGGRDIWDDIGGGRGFAEGGFAGFFARGGRIPAGQWGIAGENGPEPVVGPATVLPNSAMGGRDAPEINIRSGDIIIQGNADEKTLPMIRQEIAASEARMQRDLANNLGQYQGRWSTMKAM